MSLRHIVTKFARRDMTRDLRLEAGPERQSGVRFPGGAKAAASPSAAAYLFRAHRGIGLTRLARRAGRQQAASAVNVSNAAMLTNVSGSFVPILKTTFGSGGATERLAGDTRPGDQAPLGRWFLVWDLEKPFSSGNNASGSRLLRIPPASSPRLLGLRAGRLSQR